MAALTAPRPDAGLAGKLPRIVNMVQIGDALLGAPSPPIEAVVVYNSNPVAVAPESEKVIRGFAREDLFTVVLEHFLTDTADHADIRAAGHDPARALRPAQDLRPSLRGGEQPRDRADRPGAAELADLPGARAARMGFDDPCFAQSDEEIAAAALKWADPRIAGSTLDGIREAGAGSSCACRTRCSPRAASRRPRGSASSPAPGSPPRGSTPCRTSCRRTSRSPRTRGSARASRSRW